MGFTDLGGRIKSFNKLDINPITISNLMYSICIRGEEGFCSFAVSETSMTRSVSTRSTDATYDVNFETTAQDSFNLQPTVTDREEDQAANVPNSKIDGNCNNEYIGIPSTIHDSTRYCGAELSPIEESVDSGSIISDVFPFRISVFSNNLDRNKETGWDLTYRQIPCN